MRERERALVRYYHIDFFSEVKKKWISILLEELPEKLIMYFLYCI